MRANGYPACRSRLSVLGEESKKPVILAVSEFPQQQCNTDTDAAQAYEQRLPYMEACNEQDGING